VNASDIVKCDIPADWSSDFSQCLYDWQGLEAGALALLAAGIGVFFVQRQIKQAQAHRVDEIARRHNAARLTLPLTLAAVSDLVKQIADEVAGEYEQYGPDGFSKSFDAIIEHGKPRSEFDPIELPGEVIGSFEEFVESLAANRDIRHVAELLGSIQILLARYNDFDLNQAGAKLNLVSLLLDAAKVRLLNEKMFNYARFVDDSSFGIVGVVPPADAWDQIHGHAQSLVFSRASPDLFFPDFHQRVESYKEHDISPWIKKFE
jgi:hypothetical protein